MKILYAEDDIHLRDLFSLELEAELDCELIEVNNAVEGIEYLRDGDVDLVLSDFEMYGGNGDVLYEYVKENMPTTPFIMLTSLRMTDRPILSNFTTDRKNNLYLEKPCKFPKLLNNINKLLKRGPLVETPKYCRVRVTRFLRFNNVQSDIYLRLGNDKYVKVINKNDFYDSEILEKYLNKGLNYFYIIGEEFLDFSKSYSNLLLIDRSKDSKTEDVDINLQLSRVSFLFEMINNLGIDEKVVRLVDATVKSSIKLLKKTPELLYLSEKILRRQNFICEHSLLTAYITGAMALKMSWGSQATLQKLVMASILHDLGLEKHAESIQEETLKQMETGSIESFSWREKKVLLDHPIEVGNIIKGQCCLPPDLDWIVMHHHEKPDGSGYPQGLNASKIPPVSCLFIIAENISRELFIEPSRELNDLLDQVVKEFNYGNFKKPLLALNKLWNRTI
ncbi:MAG: response regulator [Bacteriovoracia bacterium]